MREYSPVSLPASHRIGVWFGQGINNALAARAALGQLQTEYPGADWVLFGPRSSLFLFEMDERVPVYIPLRTLEPRRPAQTRLSYYLEQRAQFKKLRSLKLSLCIGVSAQAAEPELNRNVAAQFQHVRKVLGVGGQFIQRHLSSFLKAERPLLQAGPQALAHATQLYRKVSPGLVKAVALLYAEEHPAGLDSLDSQWKTLQGGLWQLGEGVHLTVAAIAGENRLLARQLNAAQPSWLQLGLPQAMGLIAYADRVISASEVITLICAEMGRADRLLLVKSDS
ncbi:MAG: hypothetical protein LW710_09100 [Burkholderiales bacterium]|jgi:hypothetical protein|uniref:hypothetical protein n=1 Tax=Limnobacter sp. TaxID=2003368 RepID=UPI0039BC8C08|nr:hypothetical protein [Burkholderiales bacterium]